MYKVTKVRDYEGGNVASKNTVEPLIRNLRTTYIQEKLKGTTQNLDIYIYIVQDKFNGSNKCPLFRGSTVDGGGGGRE